VRAFRHAEGQLAAAKIPECVRLIERVEPAADKQHATNLLALLDTSAEVRAAIFECIREKNCEVGAEFKTLSRALPRHGFVFTDKGVESSSVIAAVRDRLHPIISEFARRQPFPESAALAIGGKAALDAISVRPSTWYLGVGMLSRSGAEVEFSRRLVGPWRPATFGLRALRIQSRFLVALRAIAEEHYSGTLEAYWHPATFEGGLQWLFPGFPYWLRFGISGGVGAEVTTLEFTPEVYRFPVSAALTATLFQRVYLRFAAKQFVFDDCPNGRCGLLDERNRADAVQLAGITGDWMVSVGWRWID
jgi:hypothetical protein